MGQNILHLPTEIIVEILLFCDKVDVINFANAVSKRKKDIWDVITNKKLSSHTVIPANKQFIRYFENYGKFIKSLKIFGSEFKIFITEELMKGLESICIAVEELTIVDCDINTEVVKLSIFPQTLKHIRLINVTMQNRGDNQLNTWSSSLTESFFFNAQESLPNLKHIEFQGSKLLLWDLVATLCGSMNHEIFIPHSLVSFYFTESRVVVQS